MSHAQEPDGAPETAPCTLTALTLYFLRLGTTGFGGPIALAGSMQRDLVEERRWISKQDYLEGLALSQLSPGPLAAQLAMYIGWVRAGVRGAAAIGVAFVLPSFAMVVVIASLYLRYGGLPWMQGVFYGVGAAVIAIIARSTVKLAKMTLTNDALLWGLSLVSLLLTAITEAENIWLFLGSGVLAMFVRAPPRRSGATLGLLPPFLLTGAHGVASHSTLAQLGWFFTKAGAFVFGSGLAIVPFLYKGVVVDFHWLDERQFRDAVAVAMITPGPVVITAGFIGYLTAGFLGATVAATCTFLPPFLVVVFAARFMRKASKNASLKACMSGVTASAAGAIAGAVFILGRRALVDAPTVVIALGTLLVLVKVKKLPEPVVIIVAGAAGVFLRA